MVGMMQIMIWMLCVYLVFKGIEIYQIAHTSAREDGKGQSLGVAMIVMAVLAAIVFFFMEENMAGKLSESQQAIPNFNFNR